MSLTWNQFRESGYSHLIIVWNRNIICQDFAHGHVYQVVGKRSPIEKSESSSDHPRFESNTLQPAIWVRFRSIRPLKNSWFNIWPIINDNMGNHMPYTYDFGIVSIQPIWMLLFFLLSFHWRNKPLPPTLPQTLRGWKRSFRELMASYIASTSFRVGRFGWFASATYCRCRGCFSILWEYYCVFRSFHDTSAKLSAVLPHPSARAATRTYSPCYDSTTTTED